MDAIKLYFKQECKLLMLALEHPKPSDFYISVWQATRSPVPLLIWRALLFLTSIGIMIASVTFYAISTVSLGYWFIYLTHWGLTLMILSTGFGFAVSLRTYISGPLSVDYSLPWYVKTFWVLHNMSVPVAFLITLFYWTILYGDGTFGLPWYVKVYWVLYEVTITIAFFITVFYWTLLSGDVEGEFAVDPVLDLFIHGVNSIVMFCLLVTSRQPVNILHFYMPIVLGLIYTLFSVIYHFAGGTDLLGNSFIYPMIDWASPGPTLIMVVVTAIGIVIVHLVVVGIAAARNALSRLYRNDLQTFSLS